MVHYGQWQLLEILVSDVDQSEQSRISCVAQIQETQIKRDLLLQHHPANPLQHLFVYDAHES